MNERRVAIVTGASSGIGYETSLEFARNGYHVVGTARRQDRLDELQSKAGNLPGSHGDFIGVTGDIRDPETMRRVMEKAIENWGRVDVLIANAGVAHRGSLVDARWEDLDTVIQTNVIGVLHSIRAAVPEMRKTGSGHVIIVSSVAHSMTTPYAAIYAASKAFVSSISHSLRLELASDGILVTDMVVGRTRSELSEKRLGQAGRSGGGVPVMPTEQVAKAIVATVGKGKRSVILRWFDRLLLTVNLFAPNWVARLAAKQYKTKA